MDRTQLVKVKKNDIRWKSNIIYLCSSASFFSNSFCCCCCNIFVCKHGPKKVKITSRIIPISTQISDISTCSFGGLNELIIKSDLESLFSEQICHVQVQEKRFTV